MRETGSACRPPELSTRGFLGETSKETTLCLLVVRVRLGLWAHFLKTSDPLQV